MFNIAYLILKKAFYRMLLRDNRIEAFRPEKEIRNALKLNLPHFTDEKIKAWRDLFAPSHLPVE